MDERLALLLHPVRMRLVLAMRSRGSMTTGELCARLRDQPKATVYRQVARLVRAGVFVVGSEQRVRGAVERRYRLAPAAAAVSVEDARSMTLDDHRQAFTAAMTALIADFGAYLDRDGAQPSDDHVSYRQYVIWLSHEERARLIETLARTVIPLARNPRGEGRTPHLLSTVFFPTA